MLHGPKQDAHLQNLSLISRTIYQYSSNVIKNVQNNIKKHQVLTFFSGALHRNCVLISMFY